MKQHRQITILLVKILAKILRILLSLRYKLEIKGTQNLMIHQPMLILPSHQALIDPIILFSQLYKHTTAIPVATSDFYDIPIIKTLFRNWGAIRVANLEAGNRDTNVLNDISQSIQKGFQLKKNIVLYPSGQIAGQGYERIFNKKSAYLVTSELPHEVAIIGVRITGLWGSMWSKAWIGVTPSYSFQLLKSIFYILVNLIFFMPRRKVTIEFEDITHHAKIAVKKGRPEFNTFLEVFYNRYGGENPIYLKHYFYARNPKRKLPDKIAGSIKEELHVVLPVNSENIPIDTLNIIRTIVASVLKVNIELIGLESNLKIELGADSLSLVEIFSDLENQFETFSTPQINDIKTVGDLCLVAMGQFINDSDLKPSNLNKPLTKQQNIFVDSDKNVLWQFLDVFTVNQSDSFAYDALLGNSNRKSFLLKACVVAEIIKKKVDEKHVGIMLPAAQSTTLLIIATYIAGKIPVMLNWTVGKRVLEHCIQIANVHSILTSGTFISKIEDQLPESISNKLIYLEKEVPKVGISTKLKGLIISKFPKSLINYKQLDDVAVILFTSGSETLPKAVPLTHLNIVSDLHAVFSMIKLSNNHVFLSFLPPFHSFGFTVLSILPLVTGVKVAYTPNPTDAREVLKILKHTKANVLLGTPGFLKLMLSSGSEYFFKSVQLVISGAEAMTPALKVLFDSKIKNAKLLEGYGITECSPVLTINPLEKQKPNSVGQFLPGIEHIILDIETGSPTKIGEPGMIYVRGKNVFNGYLGHDAPIPFEKINGKTYYKTGDLGYVDNEGFLFITGRLKRFIKIAGEMISLPLIEKILLQKYGKEEQQVLAVEGSDTVNPVQIVLFTIEPIELNDANSYLIENGIAPIAKIRRVFNLKEIPVLGTGKIDYKLLKKLIED